MLTIFFKFSVFVFFVVIQFQRMSFSDGFCSSHFILYCIILCVFCLLQAVSWFVFSTWLVII